MKGNVSNIRQRYADGYHMAQFGQPMEDIHDLLAHIDQLEARPSPQQVPLPLGPEGLLEGTLVWVQVEPFPGLPPQDNIPGIVLGMGENGRVRVYLRSSQREALIFPNRLLLREPA